MKLKVAAGPVQFFSTEDAHNEYDIDAKEQRARIRRAIQNRRDRGEIPESLPERPRLFFAANGATTGKAGWVLGWRELADVVVWDWAKDGYNQRTGGWLLRSKAAFNETLYYRVWEAHEALPFDMMVCYLSGRYVYPETVQRIKDLGIILVNISMDDTLKFWGSVDATGFTGDAGIARVFDICVSAQNRRNVGKYVAMGANPLYMAPGGDNNAIVYTLGNPPYERPIPVSFVGGNYGTRGALVELLRNEGMVVVTRGNGWPEGRASLEEMAEILRSSLVTLGFGFIGNTPMVGLKGRDFYVPLHGAAYLTTFCPELSEFFIEDEEILFYRSRKELIDKAKWCLAHPDEARAIGLAGRKRALKEHRWGNRWEEILALCR